MNKPIRTISIFCLLLFLALMVNATYLQYVAAGDLNKDPRNRRIIEAAFSRERGAILVGRDPMAESVPSDDRFDYQRVYPQPFKYAHVTGYFSYFGAISPTSPRDRAPNRGARTRGIRRKGAASERTTPRDLTTRFTYAIVGKVEIAVS